MGWERELTKIIEERGRNVDTRLVEATVDSLDPLAVIVDGSTQAIKGVKWSAALVSEVALNDRVLLLEDVNRNRYYAVVKLA